jgi:hypothetical protein
MLGTIFDGFEELTTSSSDGIVAARKRTVQLIFAHFLVNVADPEGVLSLLCLLVNAMV